jgi:glutamate-1-semialdehyde 2,1-aminomutase/spore coat polysaccharide biosynthesis protein SpsF
MTLAIIQARLGSQRFPRKVLANLRDKQIIEHVVERARLISSVDEVVVACPEADEEDIRRAFHWKLRPRVAGISGDPNDVLKRFAVVASLFPDADPIMRLTADCPLIEPDVCARVLELYRTSGKPYAWNATKDHPGGEWPDGLNCEVFSRATLMELDDWLPSEWCREHVTQPMRWDLSKVASLPMDPAYQDWPTVSINTPLDLDRVRAWMESH